METTLPVQVRRLDAGILYSHDTKAERIQHCGGVRHLGFNLEGTLLVCSGQKEPGGGLCRPRRLGRTFQIGGDPVTHCDCTKGLRN